MAVYLKKLHQYLLISPLFIVLFHSPWTLDQQGSIQIALFGIILMLIVGVQLFSSKSKIQIHGLSWLILVMLGIFTAYSAVSLCYTQIFSEGLWIWIKISMLVIYISLLIMAEIDFQKFIGLFSRAVIIVSAVILLVSIYQLILVSQNAMMSHELLYKVHGTLGHKNLFVQFGLLLFPFCLYIFLTAQKKWKWAGLLTAITWFMVIIVFMTRSVWVAALVSTGTLLFSLFWMGIIKKQYGKWILLLGVAGMLIIGLLTTKHQSKTNSSAFSKQITKMTQFNYGTVKDRLVLWQKTLKIIKESPVVGKGLNTWKIHILRHGNQNLRSEDNVTFYQRPHNDYLWIWAELGALGLLMYLSILGITLHTLMRALKPEQNSYRQYFLMALQFALISFFVLSIFSFPLGRVAHPVLLAMLTGIVFQFNKEARKYSHYALKIKPLLLMMGLVLIPGIIAGISRNVAETRLKKAFQYRADKKWHQLSKTIASINQRFYKIDPFSTPIYWYKGLAEFNLKNVNAAHNAFIKAYKLNPYHKNILNDLGTTYAMNGKNQKAIDHYKQALQYTTQYNDAEYNLAALYFQQQKIDSAIRHFTMIRENTLSQKYVKYLQILVYPYMEKIIQKIDEPVIKTEIRQMKGNHKWVKEILDKTAENKLTFKKQLIKDALFVIEKKHNFEPAKLKLLKNKYIKP